jgi:catechol 2,3-dioxygenase-like lactoylglutathione lyase family enzyme
VSGDSAGGESEIQAQSITPVLPVPDLEQAVSFWAGLLGTEPTFVDGDRWAQFDLNGRRLALSGADRVADVPGVMVKVGDLEAARERLAADGLGVGPIEEGPHESRCVVEGPGGWPLVLYAAKS